MFLIFQRAPVLILCPVLSEATRPSFRSRRSRVAKKGRRKGGPPHCRENSIGSAIGRGGVVIFDPAIDPRPRAPAPPPCAIDLPARNRHTSCTLDAVTINLEEREYVDGERVYTSWMRKMQRLSFVGRRPRRPRPGN